MADRLLVGVPPGAGDYVQGMLSLVVTALASDATGKTIKLDAYSYTPPYVVDWGDGVREDGAAFAVVAGAGGAPNKYTVQHVYAKPQMVGGYVENGVRVRMRFMAGDL